MGSILYGPMVSQIRGSIGGVVFSRNHFGAYARQRTTPINPNTARQTVIRDALAFLTARWSQALSQAQRDAWDLYGKNVQMLNRLGQAIFLTGFNHFLRSNLPRKHDGQALIDAGPVIFELPAKDPTFVIAGSEATQQITITFDNAMDWSVEAGAFMFLYQGQPQNAQRIFFDGPWRWMATAPGIDPGGSPSPAQIPVSFAIAEGQHIWTYARISRADGRLSEPFRDDVLVGA